MDTLAQPADIPADPPPPDVIRRFALLEEVAAWRGLPPEPWA